MRPARGTPFGEPNEPKGSQGPSHTNDRVDFWRTEFERLKALPEKESTPAINSLMLTAAYMVGWSIAEQGGGYEMCVTHG